MTTNTTTLTPGDRCMMHPATDTWMRGARYGEVVKVLPMGRLPFERVVVRLDATGRLLTCHVANVLPLD